jgi:hypothetical protein
MCPRSREYYELGQDRLSELICFRSLVFIQKLSNLGVTVGEGFIPSRNALEILQITTQA